MNWKELKEANPLSFLEWVNKNLGSGNAIAIKCIREEFYAEYRFTLVAITATWLDSRLPQLPHYFDSLDIFTLPTPYDTKKEKKWAIQVYVNWNYLGYIMQKDQIATFPNFLESTKAGIQKAFEIREAQLNQAQENEIPQL